MPCAAPLFRLRRTLALLEPAFYSCQVPIPVTGLASDWIAAEAALPVGWRMTGLVRDGERWRAWAVPGPLAGRTDTKEIEGEGLGPRQALRVLARNLREVRGEMAGE